MATRDLEARRAAAVEQEERRRTEEVERLKLLVEASSTLLGSLRIETVLPRVLDLSRRTLLADAYALWHLDAPSGAWEIAVQSGLSPAYVEASREAIVGNTATVSLDEPIVAEDIATADWLTPAHRQAHAAEGNRAMLAVALRQRDRVLGTLVFYYRDPHRFSDTERSAASMLANLAAAALGTAELYEAQKHLADDQRFVAEASALLASSLDYEETLANVAALAVPRFADWCAIDMVQEDGSVGRLSIAHADPEKVRWAEELAGRFPPDADAPRGVPHVIQTRRAELISEISDELLREATKHDPELTETLRQLGLRSSISAPLVARGNALGAITFVTAESGRVYDENDLAVAQDVASRAAVAVDNARLYGEAQDARRRSQESLAVLDAVFARAPVGLAFLDRELRYVRVNEALAEINGLSPEEHYGRTVSELLGSFGDRIQPIHRKVLETGEPILDLTISGQSADGEARIWLVNYYPVRDAADETIGVGIVVADVTERELARADAEAAQSRLAVLAEASSQLAATLDYETALADMATLLVPRFADWYAVDLRDQDGSLRRVAAVHQDPVRGEWLEKLASSRPGATERVVRTRRSALYHQLTDEGLAEWAEDAEQLEALRQLGLESALVVPLITGGRTFGALTLVSADPARLYDEDDRDFAEHLARRLAVAIDNARLYQAAEERARAALVVEHVGDGVVLVDELGVIRLWNPAAQQITGLGSAETVGRNADAVFQTWGEIQPLSERGSTRPEMRPVEVNGRELWLSITGVAFEGGSVYAFRDLTAERAVESLKSDFVSTISHELRTPLAAIYGAALTLRREDVRLGEPQRTGLLEVIASESDRLARIVNDILWASRLESGAMRTTIERCDGVELARGVVQAARHYVPPNIALSFEAADGTPPVAVDADKVRQVLTNLVDNAIKYSPEGGRVHVQVGPAGPRVRFGVRDQGLGIPPTEHRRIFEKFYRLDPNLTRGVGGTGLGLYISRELVERMGGRIWVESNGSDGSRFVVELPTAE